MAQRRNQDADTTGDRGDRFMSEEIEGIFEELVKALIESGLITGDEAQTAYQNLTPTIAQNVEDEIEEAAIAILQTLEEYVPAAGGTERATASAIASARTTSAAASVKTESAKAAMFDLRVALGPLADEILRMLSEYIALRDILLQYYMEGEATLMDVARAHGLMMDLFNYIARYKLQLTQETGG